LKYSDEQRKPNKKPGLHEAVQERVAKTADSCRSIIMDFVEKQTGIGVKVPQTNEY
jgi:hypothetical protein